jgi:hypothetical protein
LIFFFISWALLFTSADYVDCHNVYPDEFLDLASKFQNDNSPVLAFKGIIYSALPCFLNIFELKRSDFLTISLRC